MALRRALILLGALCVALCAVAQEPAEAVERRIKAAFLYKFAEYVEWPAGAFASDKSPIVIGVANADAVAVELEQVVAGREVAGRPIQVRRFAPGGSLGDSHILFVGFAGNSARGAEALAQANGRPVLTVTEDRIAHPPGSVINFVAADNRVRFDISREHAERNGLQLGSQLLRVARNVVPR